MNGNVLVIIGRVLICCCCCCYCRSCYFSHFKIFKSLFVMVDSSGCRSCCCCCCCGTLNVTRPLYSCIFSHSSAFFLPFVFFFFRKIDRNKKLIITFNKHAMDPSGLIAAIGNFSNFVNFSS